MTTREHITDIRAYLDAHLPAKRLRHVEGVREVALFLAKDNGIDRDTTERAALLHDVAKWMSVDELLNQCRNYDLELGPGDLRITGVLHAYVGAAMARHEFGADDGICQAIRAHTTGWETMNALDMVIYVADYVEPGRNADATDALRELASTDLLEATIETMTVKIRYLLARDTQIHPRTLDARNALIRQRGATDGGT